MNSFLLRSILFKTNLRPKLLLINEQCRREYVAGIETQLSRASTAEPCSLLGLNLSHAFSTKQAAGDQTPPDLFQKYSELDKTRKLHPFTYFMKINYKEFKSKQPDTKATVIFSKLNEKWRSLSEEEKLSYTRIADENREIAEQKIAELQSNLSENASKNLLESVKDQRSLRRRSLKKIRIKRKQKMLGKPTKPLTSYFRWINTLDRGNANILEFTKAASIKWKSVPQEEKEQYAAQYRNEYEEYEEKLKEWESKMVAKGNMSFLRKKTAIRFLPPKPSKKVKNAKLEMMREKRKINLIKKATEKKLQLLRAIKKKLKGISTKKSKLLSIKRARKRQKKNKTGTNASKNTSKIETIKELI